MITSPFCLGATLTYQGLGSGVSNPQNGLNEGDEMKEDCIYLEEECGYYYCPKFNLYNEDVICYNCKYFNNNIVGRRSRW